MIRFASVWQRALAGAFVAACLLPSVSQAHFIWITAAGPAQPGWPTQVQVFLNEQPEPGGPEFLKFVQGVVPTVAGVPLAVTTGADAVAASWVGPLPTMIDAERTLGLKTKGDVTYQLYYTARLQVAPVAASVAEVGSKLRARVIGAKEGQATVQVLFAGKPPAGARLKTYPSEGEGAELTTDARGQATVAGVVEGKTGLWATWTDPTAGDLDGKPFSETRYYATLHFPKAAEATPSTTFATMPDPAVNSFAGAVLDDWLYVYSGHTGTTHEYSTETTARKFRRLSLKDRTTWEDLPMGRDVQGAAMVADGRYLYRTGGMTARNQPGQPQDLISNADFARFDPESKTWTDLAPMPSPRSTHDSAIVGRQVYAVGGWWMKGGKEVSTYHKEAIVFDLDHPEAGWKSFEQPFRRRALAAAEADGKLYVLGGLDNAFQVSRKVDIFDPKAATWSTGPQLPGSNFEGFAPSAFAVDGRLYVSGLSGVIARLDAAGAAWEAVGQWALPRNTHRMLPGPGRSLLAVGGNYKGEQTPVIESITPPPTAPTPPSTASR